MTKIMLVEDDNNLREIYQARLEAEGYDIVSAADGEAALAIASKERPDLVISDVMMPKISGFEMLDILRNTEVLHDVKIIMLTALGQAEDSERASHLGADKYLVKSQVTLEDIVKAAHELIDGPAPAAADGAGNAQETAAPAPPQTEPAAAFDAQVTSTDPAITASPAAPAASASDAALASNARPQPVPVPDPAFTSQAQYQSGLTSTDNQSASTPVQSTTANQDDPMVSIPADSTAADTNATSGQSNATGGNMSISDDMTIAFHDQPTTDAGLVAQPAASAPDLAMAATDVSAAAPAGTSSTESLVQAQIENFISTAGQTQSSADTAGPAADMQTQTAAQPEQGTQLPPLPPASEQQSVPAPAGMQTPQAPIAGPAPISATTLSEEATMNEPAAEELNSNKPPVISTGTTVTGSQQPEMGNSQLLAALNSLDGNPGGTTEVAATTGQQATMPSAPVINPEPSMTPQTTSTQQNQPDDTMGHKNKVIQPLNAIAGKPDINQLLAQEEARFGATQAAQTMGVPAAAQMQAQQMPVPLNPAGQPTMQSQSPGSYTDPNSISL